MGNTKESSQPDLPMGFSTIRQILDVSNETLKARPFMNVIGFIKDVQDPVQTKGSNPKCTLEIVDHSIQYDAHGLKVNIFWPMDKMPKFSSAHAVLIRNIKVQMWGGLVSLIAHHSTVFYVLQSSRIPISVSSSTARWSSFPPGKGNSPKPLEIAYVIWAQNHREDLDLPSDTEIEEKRQQSTNVKDKFSLLQDIEPENYYNILGEVIRVYDGSSGSLTIYLSDYTANSKFFNQVWGGGADDGVAYDEYGYAKSKSRPKKANDWPGPFGKMSIQLTLYDAHASFVRENVKVNEWILLSNVQVKYGNMGGCLEGFLRGDRNAFEGKLQVTVMHITDDSATMDKRLLNALARKLQYSKKFKQQQQAIVDEAARTGEKRKRGDEESEQLNSKQRRKQKRAAAEKKAMAIREKQTNLLDLNPNIKCSHPNLQTVSISQILQHILPLRLESQDYDSPFTCCKYRANVRVVDYFPHKLEDFAVGWRRSEFDALSDYSGGEDTDLEEDMRIYRSGKGHKKNAWEWRFALQVEDADAKDPKERIWLMVDNQAAQGLLGLNDEATNLRGDPALLAQLKEQLFKLWGDLEEQKSATLPKHNSKAPPPLTFQTSEPASSPPFKAGRMPDLEDSDTETSPPLPKSTTKKSISSILEERDPNIKAKGGENEKGLLPRNKAFGCCIKQYGVGVSEEDPEKANAGEGKRWQRMFGLFETVIL